MRLSIVTVENGTERRGLEVDPAKMCWEKMEPELAEARKRNISAQSSLELSWNERIRSQFDGVKGHMDNRVEEPEALTCGR